MLLKENRLGSFFVVSYRQRKDMNKMGCRP